MKKKIAVFISGRGSNMKAILQNIDSGCLKDLCEVVFVFSNRKDAKGLEIAENFNIKTVVLENKGYKRKEYDRKLLKLIEPYKPDYIILAGYMRIISKVFIEEYRNRIINIHPADTMQYQGANAYKWAYENNLKQTKITVHLVDEGVDTGKIIEQAVVDLRGAKTLEEIENRGLEAEHRFYSKVLYKVFSGQVKLT